ncbi:nose resistant to fluoxetine protein 6-like [Saccostrea echinata]|uniref:nose resistant to fluoxetine protein 6-like n=1 Tax=Saccostrea echinata TaxID=191078 RepID=UPI002A82EE9D|nr:nose resistant to fluoxetine protein 6-like [Saccostrea echinata]
MFTVTLFTIILSVAISSSVALQNKPYYSVIEDAGHLVRSAGNINYEEKNTNLLRDIKDLPTYLLFGDENDAVQYNVSEQCSLSIEALQLGLLLRQTWAIQILDAIGKPEAGILDGSLKWLGSYDECKRTEYHNKTIGLDVKGKYSVIYIPIGTTSDPVTGTNIVTISIGVCLPDSCSASDVTSIIHNNIGKIPIGNFSAIPFSVLSEEDKPLTSNAIAAIVVLSLLAAIIVVATAFDIIVVQWLRRRSSLEEPVINPALKQTDNEKFPLLNHNSNEVKVEESTLEKLLLSFSFYSNSKKLLSTRRSSDTLTALNGIRFLSISWVVLGHTYAFVLSNSSNGGPFVKDMLRRWTFQVIANALVAVDTFFALSGLLLAYLTLKEMDKKRGKMNWAMFYFHRFWRLTPAYMLILMTEATLSPYLSNGPLYPAKGFEINYCQDSWWKNLLYINNLFDLDTMCMGWTWYLANDMQFFVLSPIFLIPLYYQEFLGIIACLVFLIGTTIAPGVLSAHYEMPPSFFVQNANQDGVTHYFKDYYIKPWCRMGPYIIGILFGYLLFKTKGKVRINKILNLAVWAVAAVFAVLVLYGLHDTLNGHTMSNSVSALYNATNRTVWGACVCWVIYACATDNGGFVNTLLSWTPFGPLARLGYCVYLVHPVLMYMYYFSSRIPIYLTDFTVIYLFLGNFLIANLVAFVASVAFEAPMMGLEKVLLRRERK